MRITYNDAPDLFVKERPGRPLKYPFTKLFEEQISNVSMEFDSEEEAIENSKRVSTALTNWKSRNNITTLTKTSRKGAFIYIHKFI